MRARSASVPQAARSPSRRPRRRSRRSRPPGCARSRRARPEATSTSGGWWRARRCCSRSMCPARSSRSGDVHFAQGDGEVCGTGIEIEAVVRVRVGLRASEPWAPRFPAYLTPGESRGPCFATTGIPVDDAMDLTVAARAALLGDDRLARGASTGSPARPPTASALRASTCTCRRSWTSRTRSSPR